MTQKTDTAGKTAKKAAKVEDAPRIGISSLDEAKQRFSSRSRSDGMVILNVPVWGWTGDGKTCSLLTLLQYADATRHGLSLNLVTNRDDVTKLENSFDAYKDLPLHALAESTKTRLGELSETFIKEGEWPHGTDAPSSYLFCVRSIRSALAYLVIPDIPGGSFREVDEVARTVLANAHACVILVEPLRYGKQDPDGKRYRNEVMALITRCAEDNIPACVMITKADLYPGPNTIVDEAHNALTILVGSHDDLRAKIFRVSVIGVGAAPTTDEGQAKLPTANERHPDELIQAFIWLIDEALQKPVADMRTKVPDLGLRRAELEPKATSETIAELRRLGDFSERPGIALCAISPDTVLFMATDGALVAATFRGADFGTKAAGNITGAGSPTSRFAAYHMAGELLVAPGQRADAIWMGSLGDDLMRTVLPFSVMTWAPVTARMIVAVDSNGRLHSLRFEGGKWIQCDYIADFIPASERLIVAVVDATREVIALNGAKAEAIHVQADGKFGDRRRAGVAATYDSDRFALNRLGVFAGANAQLELFVSSGTRLHNLGASRRETAASFAIPSLGRYIAKLGSDLRLSVALVNGDTIRASDAAYSPLLPKDPDSMVWSTDGQLLVLTFPDGTYAAFKPSGLRA